MLYELYLLDAIGPSLFNSIFGPHIVRIFGQFINQNLLTSIQSHIREFQWRRLISIGHHVATDDIDKIR